MTDKFSASEGAQISEEERAQFEKFKKEQARAEEYQLRLKANAEICAILGDIGVDVFLADEIAELLLDSKFEHVTIEAK